MGFESWPWWLGALAMSTAVLGLLLTTNRAFGASGFWSRSLAFKSERALKKAEDVFAGDPEAFQQALLAATMEEFGPVPVPVTEEEMVVATQDKPEPEPEPESEPESPVASVEAKGPALVTPEVSTTRKKKRRTKSGLKKPKKKHKKKPGNRRSAKRKR